MARILVVDDEPDICDYLGRFLTKRGFGVSTALSGEEALERIEAERPHLMLLDIHMPGMNGFEVMEKAKELNRTMGIIVVTALDTQLVGRRAIEEGAKEFITKPIDLDDLHTCIKAHL